MKTKESRSLISWIMVLVILVSSFSPLSVFATDGAGMNPTGDYQDTGEPEVPLADPLGVGPMGISDNKADLLTDVSAIVSQGEAEIPVGGTISGTENIQVSFSFKLPVLGDFFPNTPSSDTYVQRFDKATLKLSNAFKVVNTPNPIILRAPSGDKVGEVTLKDDPDDSNMVIAEVNFNGDEIVFEPKDGDYRAGVSAHFEAELQYKGPASGDPWGTEDVTLLGKTYQVKVDEPETAYTVTKNGVPDISNKKVNWTVTIDATKTVTVGGTTTVKHIDLNGYKFTDDLSAVGKYITGSFQVDGDSKTPTYDDSGDKVLRYEFPAAPTEVKGPVTITFETEIPDANYYNAKSTTITNNAQLKDSDDNLEQEGTSNVVTINPPKWIEKSGVVNEYDGSGNYDPKDRTITWYITVNHAWASVPGLVIADVLDSTKLEFVSAKWQKLKGKDSETYPENQEGSWQDIAPSISSAPADGRYEIGNLFGTGPDKTINYKGRLVLVTKVNAEDPTAGTTEYKNDASVTWANFPDTVPKGEIDVGIGVNVGYNALEKSGVREDANDPNNRKVNWTVTFDPKGQTFTGPLKIYDLLVYDKAITLANTDISGHIASGVNLSDITPRYGQKYVTTTGVPAGQIEIKPIELTSGPDSGKVIADLLIITPNNGASKETYTFTSEVLDPDLFAGNGTRVVNNTATLFQGNVPLNSADGQVDFVSDILAKEMLHRDEAGSGKTDATILPNHTTTNAGTGFNHITKEVIFRLSINAERRAWPAVTDVAGNVKALGDIVVTDTLPTGWEFVPFKTAAGGEQEFLIYDASGKANNVLQASGSPLSLPLADLSVGQSVVEGKKIMTFTFSNLRSPYVILVKARPTEAKFRDYLAGAGGNQESKTETNNLKLNTQKWESGVSSSRTVQVKTQVLNKNSSTTGLPDGEVKWTVDYKPYGLQMGNKIEDKLPQGIDLRTDATGMLKLEGNIEVYEMTLKADGNYDVSPTPIVLQQGVGKDIWYDTAERILHFRIPNSEKAYRLSYITDVTRVADVTVSNQVSLKNAVGGVVDNHAQFQMQASYGAASMERFGFLQINKITSGNSPLPGAKFGIFTEDGNTLLRESTSGSDGKLTIAALAVGKYQLKEIEAPTGFKKSEESYAVEVTESGSPKKITVSIGGQVGVDANKLDVMNYAVIEPVGSLRIVKNIAGNDAEPTKKFNFTITFSGLADPDQEFTYVGYGVPGGKIRSGGTVALAGGQSITIQGLPAGATYTVSEDADGYLSTVYGETSAQIEDGKTHTVNFINTKNKAGTLTISKTVEGTNFDNTRLFTFTVTFTGTPAGAEYDYTKTGGASGKIRSGDTIALAHGESIDIVGLPGNAGYKVVESGYLGSGYTPANDTIQGTMAPLEGRTAAFLNRAPGSLTVSKTVAGNAGDVNKKFKFYVTLPAGSYPYSGASSGTYTFDGTNPVELELAHNETITITGIPDGVAYTVTEADYRNDGYRTSATGTSGTISAGGAYTAAFTNTRSYSSSDDDTGSLTIKKTVNGTSGDRERRFTFVVTFSASGKYHYSGSRTGMISSGDKITLAHNEHIEISGLPVGSTYKVTEEEANKGGYHTTSTGASGTISRYGRTADFVNTRGGNPNTGDDQSNDRATFALITFTILLAALFGLDTYLRKKGGKPELK